MDTLALVFQLLLDPYNIAMIVAGTFVGVIVGALPGLGSVILIALLLPFVVRMEPVSGIACAASSIARRSTAARSPRS